MLGYRKYDYDYSAVIERPWWPIAFGISDLWDTPFFQYRLRAQKFRPGIGFWKGLLRGMGFTAILAILAAFSMLLKPWIPEIKPLSEVIMAWILAVLSIVPAVLIVVIAVEGLGSATSQIAHDRLAGNFDVLSSTPITSRDIFCSYAFAPIAARLMAIDGFLGWILGLLIVSSLRNTVADLLGVHMAFNPAYIPLTVFMISFYLLLTTHLLSVAIASDSIRFPVPLSIVLSIFPAMFLLLAYAMIMTTLVNIATFQYNFVSFYYVLANILFLCVFNLIILIGLAYFSSIGGWAMLIARRQNFNFQFSQIPTSEMMDLAGRK